MRYNLGTMPPTIEEIRQEVVRDKRLALDLAAAVGSRLRSPVVSPLEANITGTPSGVQDFLRYKKEEQLSLQGVQRDLYFLRVDARVTDRRDTDAPVSFLFTKARRSTGVDGDGFALASWTSPLYAILPDQSIGQEATFQAAPERQMCRFVVGVSGKFEAVIPAIEGATYRFASGEAVLAHERLLLDDTYTPPGEKRVEEYKAPETAELREIIALASGSQREAMHLPFFESVLIEGPPGSGKTSIGIMRIPCLIDRQWEELDLKPESDRAFHSAETMRILVLNEEMVDYLDSLTRSLGIQGVRVSTLADFLRLVCRESKTLEGREVPDTALMARLKTHPLAVPALWAGFRLHVEEWWRRNGGWLAGVLKGYHDAGESLRKGVAEWIGQVASASVTDGTLPKQINLGWRAAEWFRRRNDLVPDERNPGPRASLAAQAEADRENARRREMLRQHGALRELLRHLVWRRTFTPPADMDKSLVRLLEEATVRGPLLLDRTSIVTRMFSTTEYRKLLSACEGNGMTPPEVAEADKEWRAQYAEDRPTYSEFDAMLCAWLGIHVSLVPASGPSPVVAGRSDRLTHVLIDEAQDVSPAHVAAIRRLLEPKGTLTIVGDLRQRLRSIGGVRSWEELGVPDFKLAAFTVNYRQSRELGTFVHRLHQQLYHELPVWKPSPERAGPLPRVVHVSDGNRLVHTAAAEIRRWREAIPRGTVGVLYDRRLSSEKIKSLRTRLETLLQDSLTAVYVVTNRSGGANLRRTDCAILAPVAATKGLEFDAVVFVDVANEWKDGKVELSDVKKNGLYVATSRAKQGLSLVMRSLPEPLQCLGSMGVCEVSAIDS